MTKLRGHRELGTLAGLLGLSILLSFVTPYFLTVSNLLNVCEQTSINAVIAVGMTCVILTGGIDLSVGSIVALAGVVLGAALKAGYPPVLAIPLSLAAGTACGVCNGLLVTRGRLPPFIATLGMMSVARGLALMLTDGRPISGFEASFRGIATGRLAGIPVPVLATIAVYAAAHFMLTRTRFGRYVFAIGGNEEAARLSGVAVAFHKTMVYALCGLASGFAAVLLTARINSAQPIAGISYELDAIAAAVIGGTSLLGGSGSAAGTLIGALIMGVLRNGLNLLGISSFLQQVVIGMVIVCAVLLDSVVKNSRRHP